MNHPDRNAIKHSAPLNGVRSPRRRRTGAALIIAMMCLLLASVLVVSLVQGALRQREQVLRDEWQLQAAWLADSGIDRAVSRMTAGGEYTGEVWRPASTDSIDESTPVLGRIEITIDREPADGDGETVLIRVIADVPDDPQERARVRREITIKARR